MLLTDCNSVCGVSFAFIAADDFASTIVRRQPGSLGLRAGWAAWQAVIELQAATVLMAWPLILGCIIQATRC